MDTKRENIGWIDFLRVLVCFMVVLAHCCDAFVGEFDNNPDAFLTGSLIGSLMRPSVPLFVMMTAVLLLPLKETETLTSFYHKRVTRVIIALVAWSILLPLMAYGYYAYINPDSTNPFINIADYRGTESLVSRLTTFIFNFNYDTVPLWYIYMLLGLYFIMPVINSWLVRATKRELEILLALWGVSLLLPYVKMVAPALGYQGNFGHMGILGECDWNPYGTFYYVSGFAGYLVLAFYLRRFPLRWSWGRTLGVMVPMFLAGYALTAWGYVTTQQFFPGNYAYLEVIWYFSGINVFMMTLPVFVIVSRINMKSRPWLSAVAKLTFGVYLCHFTFVFIGYDVFNVACLGYGTRIVLNAVTVFTVCLGIVALLRSFRATRVIVS